MKTRVIRTAITELDENEAYDVVVAAKALTDDGKYHDDPLPTDKQTATLRLFAEQLSETLG